MTVIYPHLLEVFEVHDIFRGSSVDEDSFQCTFIYPFMSHSNSENYWSDLCSSLCTNSCLEKEINSCSLCSYSEIRYDLLRLYIRFLMFLMDDISGVIMLITLSPLSFCCCVPEMYSFRYPSRINL